MNKQSKWGRVLHAVTDFLRRSWLAFPLAFVLVLPFVVKECASDTVKADAAEKVVKLLYDFGTVEQLEMQQKSLKTFVTEEVYNQLTYDNDERRLNTYLKFCEEAVTVNIIRSTDEYVIYSLDCMTISPERKFMFAYKVGEGGKITDVQEYELLDFIEEIEDL